MSKSVEYNKLVRDNIPKIIEKNGQKANIRILNDKEYIYYLENKLNEEVAEYHKDKNVEELADILEVIYALCEAQGYTIEELMSVCQKKRDTRGGFSQKIFLISTN